MENENLTELSIEQKWEKATIANNFIFYKVMHNHPDICKELLEILLEIKIDHIVMHQEDEVKIDFGKKGIRLDVYAVDNAIAYNIEMQSTDTGEIPERARFYQSVLDVDDLDEGGSYKKLRTTYIIFICVPDIFKKGLAKYTFENTCLEKPDLKLNDRSYKYFFIAENYDKILDEKQKAFLKLVVENKSTSDFADKVSKLVEDAKHNTQWRKLFMNLEMEKRYSFEEGQQQKAIEDAVMLVNEYKEEPKIAAEKMKAPLDKVLEALNKKTSKINP